MTLQLSPAERQVPALPAQVTAKLFDRFTEYLGTTRVADMFRGSKREDIELAWGRALAGFTREEIARGVAAISASPYVPSIGEFKRLCRPALDPEGAYWEAEQGLAARSRGELGNWSHPAVWRAACAMSTDVRAANFKGCRRRWEFTLSRELEAGWGEDVPAAIAQIGFSPSQAVAVPAKVRQRLAQLSQKFKEASS